MSADQERYPIAQSWLRIGLALLAATSLSAGLWALSLPRAFFDDFPSPADTGSRPWAPTTSIWSGTTER
jgi:hypothetical protein